IDWSNAIDWSGGDPEFSSVILEGDQCLVFFLGGIPRTVDGVADCQGFSTNPRNPAAPGGGRRAICYEFHSPPLVKLHDNAFLSYLDPYQKQPYAYFSSYKYRNGYNRYFPVSGDSDCAKLEVWPYARKLGEQPEYVNPDTWQIISAGADTQFGPGTVLPSG